MNTNRPITLPIVSAVLICAMVLPAAPAATIYYVPAAGGAWNAPGNWNLGHCPLPNDAVQIIVSGNAHKAVNYNWTGATGFDLLTIDGNSSYYGALWHLQNNLTVDNVRIGNNGEAWYWMETNAYLHVTDHLYVGYNDPGEAHFYLNGADAGVQNDNDSYVGYSGQGDFDHYNGYHVCEHLFVGQSGPGTYWLKGSTDNSTLQTEYYMVIGNGDEGTFEQTGGTVNPDSPEQVYLGLNSGGYGTYLMRGGVLNADNISIGWYGDGFFTQSGGEVNIDNNLVIGCDGDQPYRAWYKVTDDDDEPTLNIGGDMLIGSQSLAKYEQLGSGTVEVTGNIEIYDGDESPYASSYLYMGLDADWLGAGAVNNHSGYFDQDGGTLSTWNFTNDSTQGINLDNNADTRIRYLVNNAGTVWMWRNALLRGPYAFGGNYWICEFTNDANFQMGGISFDGGEFRGVLTNNGTFDYYQGNFTTSVLINNGTFNLHAPFTCHRIVQNAYSFAITATNPITCSGTGYANAFENNANLTIYDGATLTVVDAPLVSYGPMYASGTIAGDYENHDYLLPSAITSTTQDLSVTGDYTQTTGAELRIRLGGTAATSEYDRLVVSGSATLAGELDVRLTAEFTPELGDTFEIIRYLGGHTGQFNPVYLPTLDEGLEWDVSYETYRLRLIVVEEQACPGDLDGDNDVDLSDLAQLLGHYGMTSGATYEDGDLDGDGDVDLSDLAELLSVYGTTC